MDQPAYRVQLDSYEGPLDLLLYLVRRAEVEIVDLPLAKIVGQFHEFLDVLQAIDLDEIGEFVLMASTLAEIKSREVLPRNDDNPVEAEEERPLDAANPRSELIHRLLEHKRFKDAAKTLEERSAQWQERYPRLSDDRPTAGKDHSADRIKDVELWDLISALGRVLKRKDVEDVGRIRYDDTPIHVYVEQIGTRIRQSPGLVFSSLLEPESQRSKIVGMFLAVLELLRHHGFRAAQSADFGEITMYPPLDDAPAADAES